MAMRIIFLTFYLWNLKKLKTCIEIYQRKLLLLLNSLVKLNSIRAELLPAFDPDNTLTLKGNPQQFKAISKRDKNFTRARGKLPTLGLSAPGTGPTMKRRELITLIGDAAGS
jgi:hypothetical protein